MGLKVYKQWFHVSQSELFRGFGTCILVPKKEFFPTFPDDMSYYISSKRFSNENCCNTISEFLKKKMGLDEKIWIFLIIVKYCFGWKQVPICVYFYKIY